METGIVPGQINYHRMEQQWKDLVQKTSLEIS